MERKRQEEIDKSLCLINRARDLYKAGCVGVHDNIISVMYKSLKALFGALAEDNEPMGICSVCNRYGVTAPTIYKWLDKHQLPRPIKIEDAERVEIPRWVIDELDKHHEHKT